MYIFELKINNPVEVLDQTRQPAQSLKSISIKFINNDFSCHQIAVAYACEGRNGFWKCKMFVDKLQI